MTESVDDLRSPLSPTRATQLRDDPQAVATRLLFCADSMPRREAFEALGDIAEILLAAGVLLQLPDDYIAAPFHLRTAAGLYLFSDYLGEDPDGVMGAGETTAILYRSSKPAATIEAALDLGCGAGTLALLLARSSHHAIGTDINERAIVLARFNAAINGVSNVEFLTGNLFEPVAGRKFDIVVSQPPYYPSRTDQPDLTFLHGGPRGDELASRILAQLPQHLSSRGRGLLFTSWPSDREQPYSPSLRLLELCTNRREIHGTRQSLSVIEHADKGWSISIEVPADCWGFNDRVRIDERIAAEELIRGEDANLLAAKLRLVDNAKLFREGDDLYLQCPPESLVGIVGIEQDLWRILTSANEGQVNPGDLTAIRSALRRGLLRSVD